VFDITDAQYNHEVHAKRQLLIHEVGVTQPQKTYSRCWHITLIFRGPLLVSTYTHEG